MSNKLTLEEWQKQIDKQCNDAYNKCNKHCFDCEFLDSKKNAWNFAQAQEQKEIKELKKKLEKAEEVIKFYANQENWYSHGIDPTVKGRIDLNDREEFLNHEYGGKRARAYLKENEQ